MPVNEWLRKGCACTLRMALVFQGDFQSSQRAPKLDSRGVEAGRRAHRDGQYFYIFTLSDFCRLHFMHVTRRFASSELPPFDRGIL